LDDPERVEQLIVHAQALRTTDLFVQVYRGGRAWYDAKLADATPYREIVAKTGVDTLGQLITRAHAVGIRVHAWVNVLSLSRNPKALLLSELGPDVVQRDRKGRSLLSYPDFEVPAPDAPWYRMGTPGLYLDPAAPGLAERLVATFAELVRRYPRLDGLHLDYIRHPDVLPMVPGSRFGVGLDFGYGEPSRLRFQRETGLPAPRPGHIVNANRWDEWRRQKVTELVAAIRAGVDGVRPGLYLSAAVFSDADRAYLTLSQDWRRWLEEGIVDFAIPMAYTIDDRRLRYLLEAYAGDPQRDRIWAGLGVWLFARTPERALAQLALVADKAVAGEVLFSYDAIVESPALLAALEARSE